MIFAQTRAQIGLWFDATVLDLGRQMRFSYLPPLMVYFAAGISGLTQIVGAFFVKDYLGLSASFLAGLAFWAGLPWALKMPVGHLVDVLWRYKAWIVVAGAALIGGSLSIMLLLLLEREAMEALLPAGSWYVVAALLAPTGYVLQDAVADAMTVEAVPRVDPEGRPYTEAEAKAMHTTMQTLGRFAIITGSVAVALVNIAMFEGVETMSAEEKRDAYASIYSMAFAIPFISLSGVVLHWLLLRMRGERLMEEEGTPADLRLLGGALLVTVFTVGVGLSGIPWSEAVVFAGSLAIIAVLIRRLMRELAPRAANALVGTALIVFVFRAVPLPGPGQTWFQIDRLGFDEQFLSVLSLITSTLTLVGLVVLRPLMARWTIASIVVLLTIAASVMTLPNIGLYYGIHEWTAPLTGGVVDARFIAILDTAVESPLGQVAMIPMLAWIARNAPEHLKATFFAVMASFTNLALSAANLGTKVLNEIFVIERAVKDPETGEIQTPADYSELGMLLITVTVITLVAPLLTVWLVQNSRLRTED